MPDLFPDEEQTKEMEPPRAASRITLDLADPEAAAEFLEYVAGIIRGKGKISIWIE